MDSIDCELSQDKCVSIAKVLQNPVINELDGS